MLADTVAIQKYKTLLLLASAHDSFVCIGPKWDHVVLSGLVVVHL